MGTLQAIWEYSKIFRYTYNNIRKPLLSPLSNTDKIIAYKNICDILQIQNSWNFATDSFLKTYYLQIVATRNSSKFINGIDIN